MATKQFHLGDILSITTGRLVSPTLIEGVYGILNFMTNDDLFTHQLPRAADECKPYLLRQFPQFADIDASVINRENWRTWLAEQVKRYGELFDVQPIPMDDHNVIDPFVEFKQMTGHDAIPFNPETDSIDDLKRRLDKDGDR